MRTCLQVHSEWLLTPERVGIHLPTATAVAADLHLGYDQARIRAGDAVPVAPLEEQLAPLRRVIVHHGIRRLAVAGDLVEDARSGQAVSRFLEWLASVQMELIGLVPGNHDQGLRGWSESPSPPYSGERGWGEGAGISRGSSPSPPTPLPRVRGRGELTERARMVDGASLFAKGLSLGSWHVVHGDQRLPAGKVVQGHLHPMLRWSRHAAGPCYLIGSGRLVLPAFSPDAAGIDVSNDPRWRAYRCCVIAGEKVLDLGELRELATCGKARASGRRGVRAHPRRAVRRRRA